MTLSLSHCSSNQVCPWHQLEGNVPPMPMIYGHEAITTVFDETEWMVVTGGFRPHPPPEPSSGNITNITLTQQFPVWLMNLTHADLFGQEEWFQMTPLPEHDTTTPAICPPFVSNATHDPWRRADLWDSAVACAPSPRMGHITTVMNDYLYVFHGYPEGADTAAHDAHVYRIAMTAILANQWSEWRRILPRDGIDSNATTAFPLKGGMWDENKIDLPKLVVLVPDYDADDNPRPQLWMYDFTQDAWESTHELYMYVGGCPNALDGLITACTFEYSAIVVRNYFLVLGTFADTATKYAYTMDLQNSQENSNSYAASDTLPIDTLVTYDDYVTKQSVIFGIGNTIGGDSLLQLGATSIAFADSFWSEGTLNPVQMRFDGYPPYREASSAVLSLAGNMYIFGGYTLDVDAGSVWKINIGGADCTLDINWDYTGSAPPCEYDCPQDGDEAAQDKLLLLLSMCSIMFWFCGRPPQHEGRHHLPGEALQQQRGLTPQQLETCPQRVLSEGEEQMEGNTCSICLSNFSAGDEVRDLPCTHFFHSSCVDGWLQTETTCPLCRESCRPAVDARDLDLMTPALMSHVVQWLRRDMREPVPADDTDPHAGLEMSSLYSLELQVTSSGGDDESVGTNTTSASRQATIEQTDDGRERRRRRVRRDDGERSVPLTAATDSTLT